jgi:hypothetical protein
MKTLKNMITGSILSTLLLTFMGTALAEQEGALAAERLIIASRAMSAVYGQLTDEQRVELETMATERAERRAEKRGQRSAEGRPTEG